MGRRKGRVEEAQGRRHRGVAGERAERGRGDGMNE